MEGDRSSAALRSAWLQRLVRDAQIFVGASSGLPLAALAPTTQRFARRLPLPSNAAECFAARAILLEAAIGASAILHKRVHGDAPHRCDFSSSDSAISVWRRHRAQPTAFLLEWANVVLDRLGGDQATFRRVQEWSARQWSQPTSGVEAAAALGMAPCTLERICRDNAGLSFSKYHRGVRLVKAIELLSSTDLKVEMVAFEVGFRSKKNFYIAFEQWTGATPREFRARCAFVPGWEQHVPAVFHRRVKAACLRARSDRALRITPSTIMAARAVRSRA